MSKTAKKGLLALLLLAVLAVAAAGAYFSYSFFMKQAYPLKYRDIIETQVILTLTRNPRRAPEG